MVHYLNEVLSEMGLEARIREEQRDALNAIHSYLMNPIPGMGLILWGPVGTGKTVLMSMFKRCMKHIHRKGLVDMNAVHIRANYYQHFVDDRYSVSYKVQLFSHLIVNDLGFERPYGSGVDVMQEVMFDRYEQGKTTHGTTNLTPIEFIERYDDDKHRMSDRFRVMFKFIEVKGESLRTNL